MSEAFPSVGGSPTSTRSKKSTASKRLLQQRALTIEEVFGSVSDVKAAGLNPPPARTVLTPRSAEACLKNGVNPEILRIRDLESFNEQGLDPAIQRMRSEAYSQRRHAMMQLCRAERKKLINAEAKAEALGGAQQSGMTPGAIVAQQAKQNASLLEMEEKRMHKMKRRQEKELEQMLQFEFKMQEIQTERDKRMEIEKAKEEKRKREKEKRSKLAAEERRLKDLKKKAMEDAEEEQRTEQARQMFEHEKQIRRKREAQARRDKVEARNREEERLRKQEEHRLHTQRILNEQQAAIKARLQEMEAQEEVRIVQMEEKEVQRKHAMHAKRAAIEARIERNMKMAKKIEKKRKTDFFAKQDHHENLRREHLEQQAQDRELQARQNDLMEQRRLMVVAQARRDEERRKEELQERFEEEELNVQRVKEARDRNHMLQREKKTLRTSMKLENVNRVKRIQEYKRLETLRRIHEGDKRISEMMERKTDIVETRKKNALQVKIQKDMLMHMMDEAKTNGTKATKMIKEFLETGEGGGGGGGGSKKKSKKKAITGGASRSQSAGALDTTNQLGPKPSAPSLEKRLEAQAGAGETGGDVRPYVSPYETGEMAAEEAPATVTF
eukprot:CAMPEP_0182573454 /NCGR_PEP_ID=MMETSP1324-20130603/20224_1 /TAXON_ID=236786 /ORGANISM="Florenciella sp., Strain RCC1587" /LENGTH=611 /DNA_ID=CAMNT_0024788569 /DNA_START=90 /DNA_END=1925 /DNA_ORIENTATION=-